MIHRAALRDILTDLAYAAGFAIGLAILDRPSAPRPVVTDDDALAREAWLLYMHEVPPC